MSTRTFTVVQPDGTSERLTFLPTGVRREPTRTPVPPRPATGKLLERALAPFDPKSPGWATPQSIPLRWPKELAAMFQHSGKYGAA